MKSLKANTVSKLTFSALLLCGAFAAVEVAQAQVVNNNPGVSAITPVTQQVETGPVLDVVPYVLSDGYTINLTLIPSLTEFQGYQDPPPVPNVTGGLNVVQLPTSLPMFAVRQVVTTVNIWDNQTIVIGGLISAVTASTKDKVPVLGDLPGVGILFQSSAKKVSKKNLMIFVTATIVDPAGNRVHSDDELPFTQTAIPTQPVVPGQTFQPGPAAAAAADVKQ
ncbi:MAG: hypothetical protein PHY43_03545 [Verrucomicrobiales bacterium]|nr:hypothetical protein [Verrucomicrobiales bacterium]